jgi:monoamine oxidase
LGNEDEDEFIVGPLCKLYNYIAEGLEIRVSHRVKEIDYTGSKVKVTCEGEIFEAEKVVVTVPLGVLKSGRLKFSPELKLEK